MLKFVKHSNLSDIEYEHGLKSIEQRKKEGLIFEWNIMGETLFH